MQDPSIQSGVGEVTAIEWIGLALALIGLIIETIADAQKSMFKLKKGNQGKIFYGGLYSKIQYPNYTGEIIFWIGIFVASLSAIHGLRWMTISSPIIIILLLLFVSGIPTIERARKKKFNDDPKFQDYTKNTCKIIPGLY